ncbi:hypothetical protein V8D89_002941 [Ganoderma adspersum]
MAAWARLNIDVLAVVCEFLSDVSDVLSLSLTCSSMNPVAIGLLLRMRPVYLKISGPSIRRFHSSLFVHAPARALHVHAIHIDLRCPGAPPARTDDLSLLLDILDVCKHITHITVAFEQASQHLAEDPSIVKAFTTIPTLRSFSVRSSSTSPFFLLRQVSAPLRTLSIHCPNIGLSFWYPSALEDFLTCVAQTLEKLEVANFTVEPLVTQTGFHTPIPPPERLTKYSGVRSLSLGSFEGQPLLEDLQRLFPALDGTLSLGSLDTVWRVGAEYGHIRAANQRAQERGGTDGAPLAAWKRLDRVVCNGPMLFVLALRCPIRLAMIDSDGVYNGTRYIADALRENPVPCLKLTLKHDRVQAGALHEILSSELAQTLTHLTLCLLHPTVSGHCSPLQSEANFGASQQFTWEDVLDKIIAAVQPLHRLAHLRVVIGATVYILHEHTPSELARLEEYAHSFRESTFDFEGGAAALSGALPSLKNVFITTGGFLSNWVPWDNPDPEAVGSSSCWKPYERWYVSRGWRVAIPASGAGEVPEGETRLIELHDEVADTIIRKEELVLSEQDEIALHLNHGWHVSSPPLRV